MVHPTKNRTQFSTFISVFRSVIYCKQRDSPEIDHDHFLTCEFSSPSQTKRINKFSVLLVYMKTPQELLSLLTKGLSVFYNNSNNQKIFSSFS